MSAPEEKLDPAGRPARTRRAWLVPVAIVVVMVGLLVAMQWQAHRTPVVAPAPTAK